MRRGEDVCSAAKISDVSLKTGRRNHFLWCFQCCQVFFLFNSSFLLVICVASLPLWCPSRLLLQVVLG